MPSGTSGAVAVLCAILFSSSSVQGQQAPASPPTVRLGLGIGFASSGVGGENLYAVGLVGAALFGFPTGGRADLALEINGQFFKAAPPVGDEAYTAFYVLAGSNIRLGSARRVFLRPSLGIVHRSWSGTEVVTETKTSFAMGIAVGSLARIGDGIGLGPELYIRFSRADEISTTLIGLQISFQPVGRLDR